MCPHKRYVVSRTVLQVCVCVCVYACACVSVSVSVSVCVYTQAKLVAYLTRGTFTLTELKT